MMVSPALNKPTRSHEEAQWDIDHRKHTMALVEISAMLSTKGQLQRHRDAVGYALNRLYNEQAEIYKERARNQ